MKERMIAVLISLALVFGAAAASCDNGAAPDIGDKEWDEEVTGVNHPGGVLGGNDSKFDLEKVFKEPIEALEEE